MENIQSVYLQASPEDRDMVSGKFPPQRMRNEPVDSVNLVIRSEDRTNGNGNDFDFQIDLLAPTAHIRKIQMAKVILPLLPQINEHNKQVTVTHDDGDVTFDLIDGYYSVQSLVNMMQDKFLAAWQSLDASNLITVSYNIERRCITIRDDNGENFYIHNNCNFALYARNVVKFSYGEPLSITLTDVIESNSLGMIYSRYVIVLSSRLTEDQKSYSMISSVGPAEIVSILDIASSYSSAQFVVSSSFPGTFSVVTCLDYSPRINLLNRTKTLKIIDLRLEDEFGFNLSTIDTTNYTFKYPVSMWFQCYL